MTNKKYFFYIVLTIPCDMIKNFILKTFKVRKIYKERKLALFLKKSEIQQANQAYRVGSPKQRFSCDNAKLQQANQAKQQAIQASKSSKATLSAF